MIFKEWWEKEGKEHQKNKSIEEIAMYAFCAGKRRGKINLKLQLDATIKAYDELRSVLSDIKEGCECVSYKDSNGESEDSIISMISDIESKHDGRQSPTRPTEGNQ